ncbi:MAG: hypothetical protein KME28_03005 [Pelatocladus maniniholoensis HA4357-MV3]|uniref:Uncharacterized protein n=1 Tax=Pelatocladus maniniholoensis HA4357-MV3 TaxID=1117104 RepID=A0A9E3H4T5_9NOST|nr:hypothetical protein [Pelatocladus maniniholoensis HA4357-MV3]
MIQIVPETSSIFWAKNPDLRSPLVDTFCDRGNVRFHRTQITFTTQPTILGVRVQRSCWTPDKCSMIFTATTA